MSQMFRSRWAAIGAAVAVTLGAGGVSLTQAALDDQPKPVFVALAEPCRVIDTRGGNPIAAGETNALTVQITGENGDCTDALEIPDNAVGVATNVTAIQPRNSASGRSFFTVYPADATLPTTSNLNFVNGQPPTPNKVDVALSTTGQIKIYNDEGTAHAAVDIFGYYTDHTHDDRYYTEDETYTKAEVDTAIAGKADAADVYAKSEIDAALAEQADAAQTLVIPPGAFVPTSSDYSYSNRALATITDSTSGVQLARMVAPLPIPTGSTIHSVTYHYRDLAAAGDLELFVGRNDLSNGGVTNVAGSSFTTSGDATVVGEATIELGDVVTDGFGHWIEALSLDWADPDVAGDLGVFGVEVEYTTP